MTLMPNIIDSKFWDLLRCLSCEMKVILIFMRCGSQPVSIRNLVAIEDAPPGLRKVSLPVDRLTRKKVYDCVTPT